MATYMSAMTFAQAKTRVATALGGQGDSNILILAGYAIQAAIRYISAKRDWNWTMQAASDITIVAGTSDYALPTDFKKAHSVRIDSLRPLAFIDLRYFNRVDYLQDNQPSMGYTTLSYGSPRLTYIRLVPTPSVGGTLKVFYYRNIEMPSADATTLDIPAVYENMIVWFAKGYLLADRDAENARTAFWLQRGEAELDAFKADDDKEPDRETRFIPMVEYAGPMYDPTHPYYYLPDE